MGATDPESDEVAEGLTIDVIKRLLASIKVPRCDNSTSDVALSSPAAGDWESLMQITMLSTNMDVFNTIQSDECRPDLHPYRLCIGGAAISMTTERALAMDFLPSYCKPSQVSYSWHGDAFRLACLKGPLLQTCRAFISWRTRARTWAPWRSTS